MLCKLSIGYNNLTINKIKSTFLIFSFALSILSVFGQNKITMSALAPVHNQVLFGLNGMNTIYKGSDWGSFGITFYAKLNEFNLSTLRYPGGTIANWWDLYPGKFVDPKKIISDNAKSVALCEMPAKYIAVPSSVDNSLAKFTNCIDATFVMPILVLNTVSSDLASQLAMLHEARMAHVPLKFLELGNEFYNAECLANTIYKDENSKAGSGGSYAIAKQVWIAALRARFEGVEIASVGATVDKTDTDRRKKWNEQASSAWQSSTAMQKPDAFVMHHYIGTGLGKGGQPDVDCRIINGVAVWPKLFFSPFKQFEISVKAEIDNHINNDLKDSERYKLWFTEFNMKDHLYYSHGSWGHALFTALQALIFLESEDTRLIDIHNMLGNATASVIFHDSKGFDYADERENGKTRCSFCKHKMKTHTGTVTALGIVFREIGTAMRSSISFKKLNFSATGANTVPQLAGNRAALYGYTFMDTLGNEQTIVLNLSDEEQVISFDPAFNKPAKFLTWSFADSPDPEKKKDLNTFITGETGKDVEYFNIENKEPCDLFKKASPELQSFTDGSIKVARWSVSRLVKEVNTVVGGYALQSEVCTGEPVRLVGVGNAVSLAKAQWFEGNSAIGELGKKDCNYIPTSAGWHYFQLKTSCCTSAVCSIFVRANPVFEIMKIGGEKISGTTQQVISKESGLEIYGDNDKLIYNWSPSTGIIGAKAFLNAVVKVNPASQTVYTLYGTDGVCSAKQTVTIK